MPSRSAETILAILREHGFSSELLALLTQHCEEGRTGHVTFHTNSGHFSSFEQRIVGRVDVKKHGGKVLTPEPGT